MNDNMNPVANPRWGGVIAALGDRDTKQILIGGAMSCLILVAAH